MDNQYYNSVPQSNGSKGPSITAMVLAIISLSFCWVPFVSIVFLVLGIVSLAMIGKQRALNIPLTYGFLKAGKICGVFGVVLSAIFTVVYTILMFTATTGYYY